MTDFSKDDQNDLVEAAKRWLRHHDRTLALKAALRACDLAGKEPEETDISTLIGYILTVYGYLAHEGTDSELLRPGSMYQSRPKNRLVVNLGTGSFSSRGPRITRHC